MEKSYIVCCLLFPTDQNSSEAVQPTVGSFYHPPPSTLTGFFGDLFGFLTSGTNVGCKPKLNQGVPHLLVIISLIQAEVLRVFGCGLRSLHHDVFYRLPHQFHIVAIGPVHSQADWHPVPFGQEAPLRALLAPIGRVSARVLTSQGGFGDRTIHAQPFPINPFQFIKPDHRRQTTDDRPHNHSQSIPFSSSNCSTPACQSFRKTPASTHSWKRSWAVEPGTRSV